MRIVCNSTMRMGVSKGYNMCKGLGCTPMRIGCDPMCGVRLDLWKSATSCAANCSCSSSSCALVGIGVG
eukprot:scaffold32844_cov33-Phaeocystis_antarctica.AAC.1